MTRDFIDRLRSRLGENLPYIQAVLGPRQVGKTTGVKAMLAGYARPHHYVSADEVSPPNAEWIRIEWERALRKGAGGLIVFDEIQKVPQWSEVIKALYDGVRNERRLQVVLLGSASLKLQTGLTESLAGRFEILPVHHWGIGETEKIFRLDLPTYLKFGGYPIGLELIQDIPRWQAFVRNTIVEAAVARDIMQLAEVAKPALFRQTFELAMRYPAQIVSLQKLLGQLQESGNPSTIKRYLELLDGAFLLKTLEKYSGRPLVSKSSSPKLIPLAPALIHAFTYPNRIDTDPDWRGRVIESLIGGRLAMLEERLWYWREGHEEVDFVLEIEGEIAAIEVKSGSQKGVGGLNAFRKRFARAVPVILKESDALLFLEQDSPEQIRKFIKQKM